MERVFLNIPLKLVKKSKRDKNLLEQIAFAVMVKSKYCSSKIKKVSVNKVAEICHVSKQKAKKLLSDAKENNKLFVFDERSGDLTLSDRVFKCENCGIEIDRDLNAAINIERVGVDILYNRMQMD